MGLIEGYILFCITTTIVGAIQIYTPIQKRLKANHINDIVTTSPILGYALFCIFAFITAPALFLILLGHKVTVKFTDDMYNSLIKHNI